MSETLTTGEPTSSAVPPASRPLCVDLDGSLIRTDALHESVMLLARHKPLTLLKLPFWLKGGKAHLKDQLAQHVVPEAAVLPYSAELLEFLQAEKRAGRTLILATASNHRIAQAVADHLGLFDQVLASDATTNLGGKNKLAALEAKFGKAGFDYVGNTHADLPLWQACGGAYIANPSRGIVSKVTSFRKPEKVFLSPASPLKGALKAIRPVQWSKNALVMFPLILAHAWTDRPRLLATLLGIIAFCLTASAVYITNDLLDIESDRHHPRKKRRPFAAGTLSIPQGIAILLLLLMGATGMSLLADSLRAEMSPIPALQAVHFSHKVSFALMVLLYFTMSSAYSFYFKRKLLMDVVVLAGLYTLRIIAGSVAANVVLTMWLLAFSMFFFLSLAFAKRYSELTIAQASEKTGLKGRGYLIEDLGIIESVGPTCGYMAVLVFCLYINNPQVNTLYKHPNYLWLACPIMLYWITRLWFYAKRRYLTDDPLVFALTDKISWVTAAMVMAIVFIASRS